MDSGEEDFEKIFVNVTLRVFNPSAQLNYHGPLSSVYRKLAQRKKAVWSTSVGGQACNIHTTSTVHNGWNNNILQETVINGGWKKEMCDP